MNIFIQIKLAFDMVYVLDDVYRVGLVNLMTVIIRSSQFVQSLASDFVQNYRLLK